MNGFAREETRFSLCGLNCALCSMRLSAHHWVLIAVCVSILATRTGWTIANQCQNG